MSQVPTAAQLGQLLKGVFAIRPEDRRLLLLCDLPTPAVPDHRDWRWLRWLAGHFVRLAGAAESELNLKEVFLLLYDNVESNNRDLPQQMCRLNSTQLTNDFIPQKKEGEETSLAALLDEQALVIAPTHFSATAPLKNLAKQHRFRGITMPGFTAAMLPALYLDYEQIKQRTDSFKELLDKACAIEVVFQADKKRFGMHFDLRFRQAHSSSGLQTEAGQVGNFPSGESYIVPYEGEREGEPSKTSGTLPVQFEKEIVLFDVQQNRAKKVLSEGPQSDKQRELLQKEPAYGNMAEVGLGVLSPFGITAVGQMLLDEKLGLHIAFGRSDHFGGNCGPNAFNDPKNVVHIDYIYVPSIQPKVEIASADLIDEHGIKSKLMRDGEYVI